MLAGFTGNANRMGRRRNHHHARQRHKNAFFSLFTLSRKLKSKKSRKNLKILLRTHQESMTGEMNFHKSVTSCVFLRHRALPEPRTAYSTPVIFMFIMINADTLTKTESWRRTIGAARVDKGIINAAAGPDIPGRGRSVSPPATGRVR